LRHVHLVLSKLHEHQLFVKKSKCAFGARSVAYLKHVISAVSVAVVKSRLARGHHELLVCWKGLASSESSWIDLEDF
jgi:hypothetical protein